MTCSDCPTCLLKPKSEVKRSEVKRSEVKRSEVKSGVACACTLAVTACLSGRTHVATHLQPLL